MEVKFSNGSIKKKSNIDLRKINIPVPKNNNIIIDNLIIHTGDVIKITDLLFARLLLCIVLCSCICVPRTSYLVRGTQ